MNRARPKLLSLHHHPGGAEPNGHENFAYIGDVLWQREANETFEAFERRTREAALAPGQHCIIFGGLRQLTGEELRCGE
jgi:hypothetical protein